MSYVYTQNKLELIDGSLIPVDSVPKDTVLVMERAYSGPTNQVYLVQDMSSAKMIYGEKSPLISLANRALLGQAKNIALFRIGGDYYNYNNIFGPESALALTDASVNAAKDIKVYVGPEPKNKTRDAVIIYRKNKIIFSNVLGGEVNSSAVAVSGFDKQNNEIRIGSLKNPVDFTEILQHLGKTASTTAVVETRAVDELYIPVASVTGLDEDTDDLTSVVITNELDEELDYTLKTDTGSAEFVLTGSSAASAGDTVTIIFNKKLTEEEQQDMFIEYTPGKDSMNATYNELYEVYDRNLELLELIPTKAVLVGDLFNVPNVANGDTGTNKLGYLSKEEDEYGFDIYNWSDHKYIYKKEGTEEETTDISQAELNVNNEPVVLKEYNRVDFTHRLGMFAHSVNEEGDFLNVIVGVKGPKFTNPRAISQWIGTEPKRDLSGNISEDGSGLLGHPLMVGTTKYRGGFFATSNGYVDGEVLSDSTGFPVDLGKHLSIVVSQVGSVSDPTSVFSAASAYAGLVSSLRPGESTTNMKVPNLYEIFKIRESKRKALAKNGYVVLFDKPKGLTVYSGDLATRENSDYDFISTAVTVADVARLIKDTVDPYIGKGADYAMISALHTALVTALGNAQREGWMNGFDFRIRRDGPHSILIPFKIEAKDELRSVSSVVRLYRPDNLNQEG